MKNPKDMSEDEVTRLLILGTIGELPLEEQQKVHETAQALRDLVARKGVHGLLAYALVGAEYQLNAD